MRPANKALERLLPRRTHVQRQSKVLGQPYLVQCRAHLTKTLYETRNHIHVSPRSPALLHIITVMLEDRLKHISGLFPKIAASIPMPPLCRTCPLGPGGVPHTCAYRSNVRAETHQALSMISVKHLTHCCLAFFCNVVPGGFGELRIDLNGRPLMYTFFFQCTT